MIAAEALRREGSRVTVDPRGDPVLRYNWNVTGLPRPDKHSSQVVSRDQWTR